jgi:AcrR family transcriptional regulator
VEAQHPTEDPLRAQLLDAAARVFARQGYSGTKIQDIVREAGLSTGAVYGRFRSKEELLREAVVARSGHAAHLGTRPGQRVADLIEHVASLRDAPLTDDEAVRLEAFVAARREPEVAAAVADAQACWRDAIQPLVDAASADGTVAADVDPEAVLHLVRTVHLGLLLQRAAGLPAPDAAAWDALVRRLVASFGDAPPSPPSGGTPT